MRGDRLKVGMAGLGRMGARHARNLATRVPGAELVAANSPLAQEREWAQNELRVPRLYTDYREMLDKLGDRRGIDIEALYDIARLEQVARHGQTHMPEPDEADRRHVVLLSLQLSRRPNRR